MNTIMKKINAFKKDEKGATMIEYGLIATLIADRCYYGHYSRRH